MLTSYLLLLTSRRGRDNAIKARQLAALLSCDERTVRELTRIARREGHPVCADLAGYYYAATEDEYAALQRQLDSRARDMLYTRSAVKRGWQEKRTPMQGRMF